MKDRTLSSRVALSIPQHLASRPGVAPSAPLQSKLVASGTGNRAGSKAKYLFRRDVPRMLSAPINFAPPASREQRRNRHPQHGADRRNNFLGRGPRPNARRWNATQVHVPAGVGGVE